MGHPWCDSRDTLDCARADRVIRRSDCDARRSIVTWLAADLAAPRLREKWEQGQRDDDFWPYGRWKREVLATREA